MIKILNYKMLGARPLPKDCKHYEKELGWALIYIGFRKWMTWTPANPKYRHPAIFGKDYWWKQKRIHYHKGEVICNGLDLTIYKYQLQIYFRIKQTPALCQ